MWPDSRPAAPQRFFKKENPKDIKAFLTGLVFGALDAKV